MSVDDALALAEHVLAAYGAQRRLGKTDKQAIAYVQTLFQHVVSQDTTARNATNTFLSGKADVLITYESEALASRAAGVDIQYVIPRQTMLIESLAADFEPQKYHDTFRANIQKLIEAKLEGQKIVATPTPHIAPVIDIMEALKRSLAEQKKPVGSATAGVGEAEEEAPEQPAARKRRRSQG